MERPCLDSIDGLSWHRNWRAVNGEDSFVIPFPTIRPVNIVFHGSSAFDYGHFGIHVGQEDRLTFLGSKQRSILASFIDCRSGSSTYGVRLEVNFRPTTEWQLVVPCGVAHTFYGLEDIITINSYDLFLPSPDNWIMGETEWDVTSDVINIPVDVEDKNLPVINPNLLAAADLYYRLIADRQKDALLNNILEHPFTEDVSLEDGSKVRLRLQKEISDNKKNHSYEDYYTEIDGVEWDDHPVLWTGDESGICPLTAARPFYLVDHGAKRYKHDAFGLHLKQEDNLTFLGGSDEEISLTLRDCRRGSPTIGEKQRIQFRSHPSRQLRIPPGIAHAFDFPVGVVTLNRPRIFCKETDKYEPGHDVIDCPINDNNFPFVDVEDVEVPQEYYNSLAKAQRRLISSKPEMSTPVVLSAPDGEGGFKRVALRKL